MGIINKGDVIGVEGGETGVLEKETTFSNSANIVNSTKKETDFSESVSVS